MTQIKILCSLLLIRMIVAGPAFAQERNQPRLDDGGVRVPLSSGRYVTSRDRLLLDRGIRVEHHPNNDPYHEWYAPKVVQRCTPEDFLPCARVFWNQSHLTEFGEVYTAQVPTIVPLRGPRPDVLWVPELNCMTYDRHRGQQWASAPGILCQTQQGETPWHMQWVIGGRMEGLDEGVPGIYEGSLLLTITTSRDTWDIEVPIRYELFPKESTCRASISGTASLTGIKAMTSGTVGVKFTPRELGPFGTIVLPEISVTGDISDDGVSFSSASITITTTESAATSTSIDIGGVHIGPSGKTKPWTHVVAYYRASNLYEIVEGRSPSISGSSVYWGENSAGEYEAVLFLAGKIALPNSWPAGNYSGTADISITCG